MQSLSCGIAFVTIIAAGFFNACHKNDYSVELKTIDSLNTSLTDTKIEFEKIDSNKIAEYHFEIRENTKLLVNSDSLQLLDSSALTAYREFEKPFSSYLNNRKTISYELDYSQKQLQALKQDLANDAIPNDSALQYYVQETKTVNNLISSVKDLTSNLNIYLPKFENYKTQVDTLIQTIKTDTLRLTEKR